jgi:hypothetical protein
MADATVAITSGRVSPFTNLSAVYVTVTADSTTYTTASGGLPFDLFTTLAEASPLYAGISYADIRGFIPDGLTAGEFILGDFAVGTATSTTLPCTIRIYGSGATSKAAMVEISNGANSDSFSGWLLIDR